MYRSLDNPCTNVDTCISDLTTAILNFWVISAFVTIVKDLLEFLQQKPYLQRYFIKPYHAYQDCFLRATIIIVYFRRISPIKVANMTSCLLRSREAKVMKSMLSCGEFICAQSHKNYNLSYLFRQKHYTAMSALGLFFPYLQHKG